MAWFEAREVDKNLAINKNFYIILENGKPLEGHKQKP